MAQLPYMLLKSDQCDPTECNPEGKQAVKALKEELSKALVLGHPNYKLPFFLFIH